MSVVSCYVGVVTCQYASVARGCAACTMCNIVQRRAGFGGAFVGCVRCIYGGYRVAGFCEWQAACAWGCCVRECERCVRWVLVAICACSASLLVLCCVISRELTCKLVLSAVFGLLNQTVPAPTSLFLKRRSASILLHSCAASTCLLDHCQHCSSPFVAQGSSSKRMLQLNRQFKLCHRWLPVFRHAPA